MAIRSRSATSGPGRAPASDSRARDGRGSGSRSRGRRRMAAMSNAAVSSTTLRRRADALFERPRGGADTSPDAAVVLDAAVVRSRAEGGGGRSRAGAGGGGGTAAVGVPPGDVDIGTGAWQRVRLAARERLPLWVQLRCGLEARTLAALAVVLVVAAAFAVQHFWVASPQPVRAPELVHQSAAMPEPSPSPGPPPTAAGPGGRIVVDVSGKVRRPGVLRLPAGSRVADALRAAGGVKAGTDLTGLNRARVLMDGEQVVVGGPAPPGPPGPTGPPGSGQGGSQAAGPVSLNSATVEQLDTLPGVGPVLAQHIVDYRTQHGGFRSVDELRDVDGIGDRRFADLQTLVQP
ncbi:helix-hairpin-helix domain-containing protein [Streptomyces sp. NPDC019890]|uniref:helix-hairpin-helix domain-containing protein n=1 Tax=Streptomyces sp. NPDC019890 TaxID=3365064 RepID=UPI00384F427C